MTDINFYEEKIKELTEQLREAICSVCSTAAHIERVEIESHEADVLGTLMENLSHEAELVKWFADSIYFLTRLLREKTKA